MPASTSVTAVPEVVDAADTVPAHRPRTVPGVGLFIAEDALIAMTDHADAGHLEGREIMGLMMGTFFRDDEGVYAVVADTATAALDADDCSVRFSRDGLEGLFESIDRCAGETVVGWYHSHPGFGCYLSETDIRTHTGIFGDDPGFAAVIDPADGEFRVFRCRDGVQEDAAMIVVLGSD
jgi:26S proteasome regulatory subunit N11